MTHHHDVSEADIAQYTCYRTRRAPALDGRLADPARQQAPRSPRFVDMVTGDPAIFDTARGGAVGRPVPLYRLLIEEPFVEAQLTERDSLIFMENDVEVFIDGGDCYYEFEINALGHDLRGVLIWQDAYTRGSRSDVPEFDLLERTAPLLAGNYDRSGRDVLVGHALGARPAGRSSIGISPACAAPYMWMARSTAAGRSTRAGGWSWRFPGPA